MFLLSFPLSLLVSLGDFLLSWGTFPLTESSSHRGPFRHKLSQTLQAILAVTLCVLLYAEASVGSKLCAKKLRELCALCERKNSPAWEKCLLTPRVSRPVGVTSHTTPLLRGRGWGRGHYLCRFVKPIHLCNYVRKKMQETRWVFYLSQWTQNEQIQLWTRAELIGWGVTSHVPIQLLLLIPYDP